MKSALTATLLISCTPLCQAGVSSLETDAVPTQPVSPFAAGCNEIGFSGSYFYSPVIAIGTRPKLTWAETDVSWGLMLHSPSAPGWLRGNWEFLANGFSAGVTNGPGSYLAGGRALFRYNFVQPEASFVPFIDLGGGGVLDDAFHDRVQHMIGGGFEFSLLADAGLRYFVAKDWALIAMVDLQHISNAGTRSRNEGVNALGISLGAGYFY
jgi:hypothetical protein